MGVSVGVVTVKGVSESCIFTSFYTNYLYIHKLPILLTCIRCGGLVGGGSTRGFPPSNLIACDWVVGREVTVQFRNSFRAPTLHLIICVS